MRSIDRVRSSSVAATSSCRCSTAPSSIPGWVVDDQFLAGYGAAQAVPGPLFTFAAFLGTVSGPSPNGVPGAAIATIAIFLPSFLLIFGGAAVLGLAARARSVSGGP